jgi:rRNA maturation RNase YbeY
MISVTVTKAYSETPFSLAAVRRAAEFACRRERVKNAELSFVVVNSRTIRTMNKKFLGHDFITDVITFPLEQRGVHAEIYINGQQAKRQARENGVTVQNEMTRLVIHGTLHAIGYDDTKKASKTRMDSIQERYVAELSLR